MMERENQKTDGKDEKAEPVFNPVKLAAGSAAAVTAAILGSFMGRQGTIIGIAAGSLISGAATAAYERALHASKEAARTRHRTIRGGHAVEISQLPEHPHRKPIIIGVIFALMTCAIAFGGISILEAAAGKTLHGIVTGSSDRGYTLGRSYAPPSPGHAHHGTGTPAPAASASSGTGNPSASASPSPSADASPSPVPDAVPDTVPPPLPTSSLGSSSSSPPSSLSDSPAAEPSVPQTASSSTGFQAPTP